MTDKQPQALKLADALEQQFPLGTAQHYLDGEAAAPEAPAQGDLSAEANAEGFESVAAYVAYLKRAKDTYFAERNSARDAARRNREAHEWQYTMAGERLRRIEKDEALLRQALEAMDDMATDSRLLDMSATRIRIFETARDALRERLK